MLIIETFTAPDAFGGTGLFSSKLVTSGSLLWVFNPHIDIFFSLTDYAILPFSISSKIAKHVYPGIRNGVLGVLYSRDNDRFTNHSLKPNSRYTHNDIGDNEAVSQKNYDTSKTRIYAAQEIAAGEEITANYYHFVPRNIPDFYSHLASFAFLRSLAA